MEYAVRCTQYSGAGTPSPLTIHHHSPLTTSMIAMLVFLLVFVFMLGAIVGSLLNVCIYRIPLEKSIIWPGSRCSHCLQPIRWYHNLPLLSYLLLRGRCATCATRFSSRYFLVELLTGLAFVALFYLEVL